MSKPFCTTIRTATVLLGPAMFLPVAAPVEFDRDVKPISVTKWEEGA